MNTISGAKSKLQFAVQTRAGTLYYTLLPASLNDWGLLAIINLGPCLQLPQGATLPPPDMAAEYKVGWHILHHS